jgi:hypothetical protein
MAAAALMTFAGAEASARVVVVARPVVVRPVIARPVIARPVVVAHRPLPRPAITPGEAARIRYQIHEHHQMQRMALADGVVTRREQVWLHRDAAQVRGLIHTAKTN